MTQHHNGRRTGVDLDNAWPELPAWVIIDLGHRGVRAWSGPARPGGDPPPWAAALLADPRLELAMRTLDQGEAEETAKLAVAFAASDLGETHVLLRRLTTPGGDWVLVELAGADHARAQRIDPLTRLPDRSALSAACSTSADEMDDSLAGGLVFLDIDEFKHVNDRHGHLVGDAVLRELADRWRQEIRRNDLLVRYGGDEFVLLLRDADRKAATAIAHRLAETAAATYDTGDVAVRLTVSAGVAMCADHGGWQQTLAAADAAMYRDKADRNPPTA